MNFVRGAGFNGLKQRSEMVDINGIRHLVGFYYGQSFMGCNYYLCINSLGIPLYSTNEEQAQIEAVKILKQNDIDSKTIDIDFEWDGTI